MLFAVFLHVIISPCLSVLFELANSFYFKSFVFGLKLKHNVLKRDSSNSVILVSSEVFLTFEWKIRIVENIFIAAAKGDCKQIFILFLSKVIRVFFLFVLSLCFWVQSFSALFLSQRMLLDGGKTLLLLLFVFYFWIQICVSKK